MRFFVDQYVTFVRSQSLEVLWDELQAALTAATSLGAVQRAHDRYLELCLDRFLLSPRFRRIGITQLMTDVLGTALQLEAAVDVLLASWADRGKGNLDWEQLIAPLSSVEASFRPAALTLYKWLSKFARHAAHLQPLLVAMDHSGYYGSLATQGRV